MRNSKVYLGVVVAVCAVFTGLVTANRVDAPWLRTDAPSLVKVNQEALQLVPQASNIDCTKITTRTFGSTNMQDDCVVQTAMGAVGYNFIFTGTSEAIPVVNNLRSSRLKPVPNQGVYYTHSNAPLLGQYMQFYKSIRDKMKPFPEIVNGEWQHVLVKGPDFGLQDNTGRALPVNSSALAFSKNGNWMIADVPFQGFIRVNMATFEIVPFAPSMNQGNDYSSHTAQLSISNDGNYAAIKPLKYDEFTLYDIGSCSSATLPVDPLRPVCRSRDYWPYLKSNILKLQTAYRVRFLNSTQLSFITTSEYINGSNFKVNEYTLTAPGESVRGIAYLGLGDSFASGQGAFNYVGGTDTDNNKCHLSSLSYPVLIANQLFDEGHSVACSGAKTRDIVEPSELYEGQVKDGIKKNVRKNITEIYHTYMPGYITQNDFVEKYNPQIVTLSIGGNDIGFADIVKQCVMPKLNDTTCFPTYEDQQELIERIASVEEKLKTTYRTISSPGRRVYIIGYPHLVAKDGNCAANVHLDEKEIELFIALTNAINQTIKRAAEGVGAQYVDVSNAFEHHKMCQTDSRQVAVNGFTLGNDDGLKKIKFIGAESYHPNALGHELLRQAILRQTNNLKQNLQSTAPTPTAGHSSYVTAPKSGRAITVTTHEPRLIPDVVESRFNIPIKVDPNTVLLKPSSIYSIKLKEDNAALSEVTTDSLGNLSGSLSVPRDVPCGYHTIELRGMNILNQPASLSKVFYIDDCADQEVLGTCGPVITSGLDRDKDNIDDACDSIISDEPKVTYKVYLTGSSIYATKKP